MKENNIQYANWRQSTFARLFRMDSLICVNVLGDVMVKRSCK